MSLKDGKFKPQRLVRAGKRFYRAVKLAARDRKNMLKYGPSAPRFAEIFWVSPLDCERYLALALFREQLGITRQQARARVITTPWPEEHVQKVTELSLFKNCYRRWVEGLSWAETGEYERMEELIREDQRGISHGCRNRSDIIRRCENLDQIFIVARREGRLRSGSEIDPAHDWTAREMLVHVGPGGLLYKGGEGMHRFAIAYILEIPFPANFGCVHQSALADLNRLRANKLSSLLKTGQGGQLCERKN